MSLNLSSATLKRSATKTLSSTSACRPRPFTHSLILRRTIFDWLRGKKRAPTLDPLAEKFMVKKQDNFLPPSEAPQTGDLAKSSIFDSLPERQGMAAAKPTDTTDPRLDPSLMAAKLDPNPSARRRWERKMVIRGVRQRGRITRATQILRTEREHVSKSPMLMTSIKKLGPLARQIAGKSVEDAIVQMRFSNKMVAKDVLKQLEIARNEAIVMRGMGLGKVGNEDGKGKVEYLDRKGKRVVVEDKTDMYIDQAWIGRGKYGTDYDYRARGKVNRLRPPLTSISIKLKEEATRIRIAREREEKKRNRKPWVQHPDRPITAQRQYVLW